jgi:opacity protein-like surface antigen
MSRIARHAIPAVAALLLAQFAGPANAQVLVKDVRVGEHPGSTRVVLDVTEPTDLKFDLAPDGRTLSVIMPGTQWKAGAFTDRHAQGFLEDYKFTPKGDGGILQLSMNAPVQLKKPFFMGPEGTQGNRVVIDLVADPARAVAAPTRMVLAEAPTAAPARPAPVIQVVSSQPVPAAMEPPTDVTMQSRGASAGLATPAALQSAAVETAQAQQRPAAPAMAAPAADAPGGLFYLKLGGGITKLMEANSTGSGNVAATDTDIGYNVVGGLGLELKHGFRFEGEGLYMTNNAKSISGSVGGSTINSGAASGSVSTMALMGNVAYDFINPYPMTPYIFGGAGLAKVSLNGVTAPGAGATWDDSDMTFAFQAGIGISTDLTDRVGIEAQYRYFETLDPKLSDSSGNPFTYENIAHMFMVGARYKF